MPLVETFEPQIDDQWLKALEQEHQSLYAGFGDTPELEEILDRCIAGMNETRWAMLQQNTFFDTEGVIDGLKGAIDEAGVDRLSSEGRLLAIPDHGRIIYPTFQIHKAELTPYVKQVYDIQAARKPEGKVSTWVQLSYWGASRDPIGGLALKDVIWSPKPKIQKNVAFVIENARF